MRGRIWKSWNLYHSLKAIKQGRGGTRGNGKERRAGDNSKSLEKAGSTSELYEKTEDRRGNNGIVDGGEDEFGQTGNKSSNAEPRNYTGGRIVNEMT